MTDQNTHNRFCEANGCPCFGTMSNSTAGWDHGAKYYCFLHFGCKPGRAHEITNELQRLGWLVKITQTIRARGGERDWDKLEAAAAKEIRLNQSIHLLRGDHESLQKWLYRLEDTLRFACSQARQEEIAVPPQGEEDEKAVQS
ncbi:hypothetical protein [Paludibacterium sp.]|uniref:hypothetical protein n=1 Tax=Paludibacterium sp. TaxID=1917523 RepID=UPI002600EBC7|nr:hypothetical protein [Paludibacterium sp.]MBV8649701.1 hypothetical protein [Paludibacterium sp.]